MSATRHTVITTAVLAAGLSLGACSSDSSTPSNSTPTAPSVASSGASGSASAGSPSGSSVSASSASSSASSAPVMTPDTAISTLKQKAATSVAAAVRVGGGYEGASADASTMHFWHTDASGAWVKDGDVPRRPAFSDSVPESIEGAAIKGGSHAAFVLHAPLGGNGDSLQDQAFAKDGAGWGSITSTKDDGSAIAITHSAASGGAWHGARFSGNVLNLSTFVPGSSAADGHDVTRSWVMNGGSFALVSTDDPAQKAQTFTATEDGRFTSPSGKNRCDISPNGVSCELSPSATGAEGSKLISLNPSGWALVPWGGGLTGSGGQAWASTGNGVVPDAVDGVRVLPYGSTIRAGDVTCTSSTNGFACTNSKAGFTVNSQRVTYTGLHNDNLAADD